MSMPVFPNPNTVLKREEALNAVLTSIAMEETALSHIINAEGEKIQYALERAKKSGQDMRLILDVNASAASVLEQVNDIQIILLNKINKTFKQMQPCRNEACMGEPCTVKPSLANLCPSESSPVKPSPAKPCPVKPNPEKPGCACVTEFKALAGYRWSREYALHLNPGGCPDAGVKISRWCGESTILLPAGRKFKIELDLSAYNGSSGSASFEASLARGAGVVTSKRYAYGPSSRYISLIDTLDWETPRGFGDAMLTIRLLSPKFLKVLGGGIKVTSL